MQTIMQQRLSDKNTPGEYFKIHSVDHHVITLTAQRLFDLARPGEDNADLKWVRVDHISYTDQCVYCAVHYRLPNEGAIISCATIRITLQDLIMGAFGENILSVRPGKVHHLRSAKIIKARPASGMGSAVKDELVIEIMEQIAPELWFTSQVTKDVITVRTYTHTLYGKADPLPPF